MGVRQVISRCFRRDPLDRQLDDALTDALFLPPLLERKSVETNRSLDRLRADKAIIEQEIADRQEELRQVTVAIAADEAAQTIISAGHAASMPAIASPSEQAEPTS